MRSPITIAFFILLVIRMPLFAETEKPTIAVWDLELGEGVNSSARVPLSDKLRIELFNTQEFIVLDRSSMGRILEEQEFQQTECVSNECIVEVGQLLGVQKMVSGGVGKLGRTYLVTLKIIDMESGEIEKTADSKCKCEIDELTSAIEEAVIKLAGSRRNVFLDTPLHGKPVVLETGSLSISTTPAGAKVYLDAGEKGFSPITLESVTVGRHTLTLLKTGYNIITESVDVEADKITRIEKSLSIQTGEIQVNTRPPGTKIYLDGTYAGVSPYRLVGIPVGRHQIKLQYTDDYLDDTMYVDVNYADTTTIAKNLQGKPSKVLIVSTPDKAKVYIDGSYKGDTPYQGELEPRAYRILVKKDGYFEGNQSISLSPNSSETIAVTLKKMEVLSEDYIKEKVIDFYNNKGEWAGVFTIDDIVKIRIVPTGDYEAQAHVKYKFVPIPNNRLRRKDSGFDQRIFYLKKAGDQMKVVKMGGYMSAEF